MWGRPHSVRIQIQTKIKAQEPPSRFTPTTYRVVDHLACMFTFEHLCPTNTFQGTWFRLCVVVPGQVYPSVSLPSILLDALPKSRGASDGPERADQSQNLYQIHQSKVSGGTVLEDKQTFVFCCVPHRREATAGGFAVKCWERKRRAPC